MIVGILLLQAVVFAVLSAIVASDKNRDPAGWGVLGFLFGLFGFIAAVAVGEAEETQSSSRQSSQSSGARKFDPDEHEKKCPMCAEYIKLEARRCKHCGHEFSEEEVERQMEEKRQEVEETAGEGGELYCQRTEKEIRSDVSYACPHCGQDIQDGRHPPVEEVKSTREQKSEERNICPNCYTHHAPQVEECSRCGVSLTD